MQEFLDRVLHGNSAEIMAYMPSECIDLTVTSPPYDDLRTYNGYEFPFEDIANQLFRVTKKGGVVVWIVSDQTKDFCESMTSFKQAMYFREIGFKLLDTMIFAKKNYAPAYPTMKRYAQTWEYMFVFVKGKKPKTFNPIQVEKTEATKRRQRKGQAPTKFIKSDGSYVTKEVVDNGKDTKDACNVWNYGVGQSKNGHPAVFPEQLAEDHILSWSEPGDTVMDCMCGSGTTLKMAYLNNRNFIGIDYSKEYVELSQKRLKQVQIKE